MASSGQIRGSCRHIIASFDEHYKCARCRHKGVGDDPCVLEQDCRWCVVPFAEERQQHVTPMNKTHKEHQKKSKESLSLINPETGKLLGKVESGQVVQDTTLLAKIR